nr:MAG TPA: Integrase [Caudoviricetes sp.]
MGKAKNAAGAGTIRQRANGLWEGRITIGTNPGTGKPIRKSVYGKTQKEVRRRMTEITRELDKNNYKEPSKITVAAWMKIWLDNFTPQLAPLSRSKYDAEIKNHIIPALGALQLDAVSGLHVQSFYNSLTKAGLSGKTVSGIASILRKSFNTAIKQKLMQSNPCLTAELPRIEKPEINPLTDEEIPRFLAAIAGHPLEHAFAIALFTGMREGELLGLSWEQVDFASRKITINQQLQRSRETGEYFIRECPKNRKTRVFAPPDIAWEHLKLQRAKQLEMQRVASELWSNPDNLVFTDACGKHLTISAFYKQFKRVAADFGRPELRVHDLRHTTATIAIASNADIKSVQNLLGHATAAFTLNTYAHTSEKMMQDTASRMQAYYSSLEKSNNKHEE